jgi:hypothetical protein
VVGEVVNIDFTNGGLPDTEHMHYIIYIDSNADGVFSNDSEDEDPLMAFQTIR